MPMPPYPVRCSVPGCPAEAVYKVAAHWSDGITDELKTYGLACGGCLSGSLSAARAKRAACRLVAGETLSEPGVYELSRGGRDKSLVRRPELDS
jgi:hypothetical protein